MPRLAVEDNNRLSLRISSTDKAVLVRAAALRNTDLTDFVRQHSLKAAVGVMIASAAYVNLTEGDSLRVMESLENPPASNARLLAAAKG